MERRSRAFPAAVSLCVFALAACATTTGPQNTPPNVGNEPDAAPVRLLASPLSPAQAAQAYAAHPSMLGTGLAGPNGLALDAAGNLYEADWNRGTVTKITPAGVTSTYASGFKGCAGLAFTASGTLLVAAYNGNTLEVVPAGGGSHKTLATGFNRPVWPAVDSKGKIYLADYSNGRIALVGPNGQVSTFVSMSGVNAIAVDPQDNLWVCSWGGQIAKITRAGVVTPITSGLWTACGIAWSPNYLAVVTYGAQNKATGRLLLIDFAGKTYEVATGLDRASSVIFDPGLNLYTADVGDTGLRRFALSAGATASVAPSPKPSATMSVPPSPMPSPKPTAGGSAGVPPGTIFLTGDNVVTVGAGGVFTPSHIYVRPGAKTRFVNVDTKPHTVTGFGGATSNSGSLSPGGSYSHGWAHPGTWTFHDTLTPNAPTFYVTDVPL